MYNQEELAGRIQIGSFFRTCSDNLGLGSLDRAACSGDRSGDRGSVGEVGGWGGRKVVKGGDTRLS